eukprot:83949-Chlamydomonas_euryale.AAC.1
MVDALASKAGLFIHGVKTEIVVVGQPVTLPTFLRSGKEQLLTVSLTYLGSFLANDGLMTRGMSITSVHWSRSVGFQGIWASQSWALLKIRACIVLHIRFAYFIVRLRSVNMDEGSDGQTEGNSFWTCPPAGVANVVQPFF